MARTRHLLPIRIPLRRLATAAALLLAMLAVLLPPVPRAEAADDIDLLRENGGNPYVMVLIDTSASMALQPPEASDSKDYLGDLAAANADDAQSKLLQVKKALYEVFSKVENVSFGFAGFNLDHAEVLRKHWLYEPLEDGDFSGKLTYPTTATHNATTDLVASRDALESFWVFGDPVIASEAGTCNTPIDFSTLDKDNTDIQLNRFPKRIGPTQTTRMWIQVTNNSTFLLEVSRDGATSFASTDDAGNPITLAAGGLGDPYMLVHLTLSKVTDCSTSPVTLASSEELTIPFKRVTDFLMVESDVATGAKGQSGKDPGIDSQPAPIANNNFLTANCKENETIAGFMNLQDIKADGTCGSGSSRPFTGRGLESDRDSGARAGDDDIDPFCLADGSGCYNLRFPTVVHPKFAELDSGDFLPMDWEVDHREEFLKRLNPRHPDRPKDGETDPTILSQYYGIASYFENRPDPTLGILKLKSLDEKPLMAFGNSPLARAVNDFRCWYLGDDSNKCKQSKNGGTSYDPGFEALFQSYDEAFKCRIPYMIVITDGEENSKNEDSTADFSDFDQKAGIRTWVFTFQDTPAFNSIIQPSNGELIKVANGDDLKTKLQEVIGTITQATRTFATAAVPSVQAAVESRIYLTKFQPLNDAGVWEGHVHAFKLPMPTGRTDPPNAAYPNHIWDAAVAMLDQSPDPPAGGDLTKVTDLKLGGGVSERRVLWAREAVPANGDHPPKVPATALMFNTTPQPLAPNLDLTPTEADFWTALKIPLDPNDPDSIYAARAEANDVVKGTLVQKNSTVVSDTDDLDTYLLGEVFHSNPLVVGGPVNTTYFVQDAEETRDGSGVEQGTGYQEFFNKHENRRKLVIAGANDGMLHAFEAGVPGIQTVDGVPDVRFTQGTGRELFSFMPREVMPTVKLAAENPETHRWSVDGSPSAGDVFIDPVHDGAPAKSDRQWRTVVITGLREGGSGYFALDVTQPDPLTTADVGPSSEPVASRNVSLIDSYPTGTGEGSLSIPTPNGLIVPGCYNTPGDGTPGCDVLEYPSVLWQFTDRAWNDSTRRWVRLDEEDTSGNGYPDGNAYADLGETWSTPNIGRIKVVEGSDTVNKYVAIFGGGLDPLKASSRGNWLYIVDIETGQAIYKRQLDGSAPSDPAAVDSDQDGYIDRVYIGTTAGSMYRLDLTGIDGLGNVVYPRLLTRCGADPAACVRGVDGQTYSMPRIEKGTDSSKPLWEPRKIFDTVTTISGTTDTVRRPIYFPPAVLFVGDLGEYALAFGTGDRDDLTSKIGSTGRFYVFVDESNQLADSDLPMTETNFEQIDRNEGGNPNLLTDPNLPVGGKGWFLVLNEKERLIGDAFGFSGVTFFASFEPSITASCSVTCPDTLPDGETCTVCKKPDNDGVLSPDESPQCTLGGTSRIYVVGTTDANAFIEDANGVLSRSFDIQGQFVTSPFTEQAVSATNTSGDDGGDGSSSVEGNPLTDAEKKLMEKLQTLFPAECKFGNHRIDIKVIQANSEIQRIAAVPICIVEKNWKEVNQ